PLVSTPHRHPPDLPSFPTRRSSDLSAGDLLVHYGHGVASGTTFPTQGRAAVTLGSVPIVGGQPGAFEAAGYIWNGDSGSAIGFGDRKSTRLNSSHQIISYAVFCLKK